MSSQAGDTLVPLGVICHWTQLTLGSVITPGQVGSQAVLPDQLAQPAESHVQVGPQQGFVVWSNETLGCAPLSGGAVACVLKLSKASGCALLLGKVPGRTQVRSCLRLYSTVGRHWRLRSVVSGVAVQTPLSHGATAYV